VIPIVLVHGGGFDSRCWEPLLPHLNHPALAVDLPGRGAHPAPLDAVTLAACAAAVRDDVDAAGFDHVMVVGHSLAGSMPSILDVLGERVGHAVFVACTVPNDGRSAFDMLDPPIQEMIRTAGGVQPRPMDPELAKLVLGNDLTDDQFAWCVQHLRCGLAVQKSAARADMC
jgi:pimeloyl-ACP methyl ester carboxylesterase